MFNPKYTISNKLLANIKRIAGLIVDLNNRRFSDVVLTELKIRARVMSVFSSTSIEGNPLPLIDVKRILKNKPEYVRDSEKEILNYNKALVDLDNLIKKENIVFGNKLILNIQETVTKDLIEKYRCGKIRQEPVFVNNPKTGQTIYLPPEEKEVEDLLNELFKYLSDNENKIDSLILAGIFHKQFVVIHPFVDGNGRTARLATKLLLAKMGLDTFNLFSFENYYNQNVSKYFKEVGILGDYYDIKDEIDFTSWLEYFTDGIIDELLRVGKELNKIVISPKNDLKKHHQIILNLIKRKGYITDQEYSNLTNRAKPTRNLDFNKLISLGIIEKLGKGKATYYKLK
ncbi:MAG: Fic family protein [Patescibacteria group bacterium]|jgi:Fic family protein|nr:Fic family protein [Patescibacteria group bacterium]